MKAASRQSIIILGLCFSVVGFSGLTTSCSDDASIQPAPRKVVSTISKANSIPEPVDNGSNSGSNTPEEEEPKTSADVLPKDPGPVINADGVLTPPVVPAASTDSPGSNPAPVPPPQNLPGSNAASDANDGPQAPPDDPRQNPPPTTTNTAPRFVSPPQNFGQRQGEGAESASFSIDDDAEITCAAVSFTNSAPNVATNVVITGQGQDCTISATPGEVGTSNLQLALRDAAGLTANASFAFTVEAANAPVNSAPTIATMNPVQMEEGNPQSINVTVNDDSASRACAGNLSATTQDTILVSSFTISGNYPNCTVTPVLQNDQFGKVNVTLIASDGVERSAAQTFELTVTNVDDKPEIVAVQARDLNIQENERKLIVLNVQDKGENDLGAKCIDVLNIKSNTPAIVPDRKFEQLPATSAEGEGFQVSGTVPTCHIQVGPKIGVPHFKTPSAVANAAGQLHANYSFDVSVRDNGGALSDVRNFSGRVVGKDDPVNIMWNVKETPKIKEDEQDPNKRKVVIKLWDRDVDYKCTQLSIAEKQAPQRELILKSINLINGGQVESVGPEKLEKLCSFDIAPKPGKFGTLNLAVSLKQVASDKTAIATKELGLIIESKNDNPVVTSSMDLKTLTFGSGSTAQFEVDIHDQEDTGKDKLTCEKSVKVISSQNNLITAQVSEGSSESKCRIVLTGKSAGESGITVTVKDKDGGTGTLKFAAKAASTPTMVKVPAGDDEEIVPGETKRLKFALSGSKCASLALPPQKFNPEKDKSKWKWSGSGSECEIKMAIPKDQKTEKVTFGVGKGAPSVQVSLNVLANVLPTISLVDDKYKSGKMRVVANSSYQVGLEIADENDLSCSEKSLKVAAPGNVFAKPSFKQLGGNQPAIDAKNPKALRSMSCLVTFAAQGAPAFANNQEVVLQVRDAREGLSKELKIPVEVFKDEPMKLAAHGGSKDKDNKTFWVAKNKEDYIDVAVEVTDDNYRKSFDCTSLEMYRAVEGKNAVKVGTQSLTFRSAKVLSKDGDRVFKTICTFGLKVSQSDKFFFADPDTKSEAHFRVDMSIAIAQQQLKCHANNTTPKVAPAIACKKSSNSAQSCNLSFPLPIADYGLTKEACKNMSASGHDQLVESKFSSDCKLSAKLNLNKPQAKGDIEVVLTRPKSSADPECKIYVKIPFTRASK